MEQERIQLYSESRGNYNVFYNVRNIANIWTLRKPLFINFN